MNRSWRGWNGLSVLPLFLVFAALMAAFIGTVLLFPGKLLESLWRFNPEGRAAFQNLGRLSSLLLFVVGAVAGGAAVGLRRRRKWGWWFAILLLSVNALGDVVSLLVTRGTLRGAFGVLVSGSFVWYLTRTHVRQQFRDHVVTAAD